MIPHFSEPSTIDPPNGQLCCPYTISRLKDNARPLKCGQIPYDKDDPINRGVTDSYQAGMSCGWLFRVVEFTDSETGEEYSFITNPDNKFKPGLIAWLYFKRWSIEKNFDTTKNSMQEKKAWGSGKGALFIQSHAIVFAYNMMRLFHETIAHEQKEQGNTETLSERKYRKALEKRKEKAARVGQEIHPLHLTARMVRLPSAFVRCFRMCFLDNFSIDKTWGLLTNTLYTKCEAIPDTVVCLYFCLCDTVCAGKLTGSFCRWPKMTYNGLSSYLGNEVR